MKRLAKPIQFLYCIYALLTFIALMFLVFPFIMLSLLWGKIRGGNMIYQLCRFWGHAWYLLIGVSHREIYEAPHDRNRRYIFVANHISYMDIPPIVMIAHQPLRILGKYEMVRIPVFGWIYRAAVILVDRRNPDTRSRSVRALKAALKYNISIFIFPEGTFNETAAPLKAFFDGAFRLAIETQTPIKPVLLVDTHDRLHYRGLFNLTPGPSRVVYLEEIPVTGLQFSDIQQLKAKVHDVMEAGLRRYRVYGL
ncbi:MAG: 1-acyl-sn-glycerol-3-phosphate acyltransferase [Chitinophagaceae bacterium]|nr:1-acyl-sn-glycerol-3-phosphate acyltransferase [Chitinophagaceae bacterium]